MSYIKSRWYHIAITMRNIKLKSNMETFKCIKLNFKKLTKLYILTVTKICRKLDYWNKTHKNENTNVKLERIWMNIKK